MTTARISTLGSLAAAVAAQNSESVAIPPGASPETAVSLSQSNEFKYRQWIAIQNNAPQGPLNLTQMMMDVTAEVCHRAVAKGEVVLTKDNSKLVVTEDGMRLDPESGKIRVADDADFPLARVDELYQKFAERLTPHFDAHFARSENPAQNEMRLITEAHLAKLQQRVLKQYENEALEKIWKLQLVHGINLQNNPNLQTHEEIRAWINNPENTQLLMQVTELDLSVLNLQALPPEIGRLTALHTLYLNCNLLTSLPPEIGSLTALQWLDLINNHLTSLPPEISGLTVLQSLTLNDNLLTSLLPEIGCLTALHTLELSDNQLTSLPPEIGSLTALQTLELERNQLTSLPPEIASLTALHTLYLNNNQLTSLPPEISRLTALQWLNLNRNRLTSFPHEISRLTALQWLNLNNNQLTSIPEQIGSLTALQWLYLENNPLLFIFDEDLRKISHFQLILDHYQRFMDYPTQSSLGNLFKLIASNAEAVDIQNVFEELDATLQQKIVQLVGITGTSAGPSTSSASNDESLFIDIPRFGRAVREATMEIFNNLREHQKNKVYVKIWELAGKPKTKDPKWCEHHLFDEVLRFVDALEAVRAQK